MEDKSFRRLFFGLLILFALSVVVLQFVPKGVRYSPETNFAPFDSVVNVKNNNAPTITDFNPNTLSFVANGDEDLYFNISFEDADLDVLKVSWYVDSNLIQENTNSGDGFDEFNFNFGCDVSGNREIKVEVNDGFAIDSVSWNVDLQLVNCPSDNGDSSGGGIGSDAEKMSNFTLSRDLVELSLFLGEENRESIIITNNGESFLNFDLSLTGLDDLAVLNVNGFSLNPGELKVVDIDFSIPMEEVPGVMTGSLNVKSNGLEKVVNFVLEVVDAKSLFDLGTKIDSSVLTVKDKLNVVITMTDISGIGDVNVLVEYFIKDFNDKEINLGNETLNVNGTLEIKKSFDIPDNLIAGNYVFYTKITYDGKVATSSSPFELTGISVWYKLIISFIFFVFISLVIVGIIYFGSRKKKVLTLVETPNL